MQYKIYPETVMEKQLEDKVAIVTGGSYGIGKATAIGFAKRGACVVLVDWKDGSKTVDQINSFGGDAMFIQCDVSKASEVEKMTNQVIKDYSRIDFAFNNAGIEGEQSETAECSVENWDKTININLKGIWLCMKHQIPHMLEQGSGSIVNCASVAGLIGYKSLAAYVASKHGVIGLTKTAALEYATRGIRINAICPGVIKTKMIDRITGGDKEKEAQYAASEPIGRMGKVEEVAEAAIWLCSDAASFVTGIAMPVDGGYIAQ